jgi:hypothetical protein
MTSAHQCGEIIGRMLLKVSAELSDPQLGLVGLGIVIVIAFSI